MAARPPLPRHDVHAGADRPDLAQTVAITFDDGSCRCTSGVSDHGAPGASGHVVRADVSDRAQRPDGLARRRPLARRAPRVGAGGHVLGGRRPSSLTAAGRSARTPARTRTSPSWTARPWPRSSRSRARISSGAWAGPAPRSAYPYGDVDERVVQATAQAGYRTAAGLPGRYEPEDPLRWPREGIYCYDEMPKFRRKVQCRCDGCGPLGCGRCFIPLAVNCGACSGPGGDWPRASATVGPITSVYSRASKHPRRHQFRVPRKWTLASHTDVLRSPTAMLLLTVALVAAIASAAAMPPATAHAAPQDPCAAAYGGFSAGNWPPACWRPYSDASPFNVRVPPNPTLHPRSAQTPAPGRLRSPEP